MNCYCVQQYLMCNLFCCSVSVCACLSVCVRRLLTPIDGWNGFRCRRCCVVNFTNGHLMTSRMADKSNALTITTVTMAVVFAFFVALFSVQQSGWMCFSEMYLYTLPLHFSYENLSVFYVVCFFFSVEELILRQFLLLCCYFDSSSSTYLTVFLQYLSFLLKFRNMLQSILPIVFTSSFGPIN